MRTNIVHRWADELKYEIREIVAVGKKFEKLGVKMYWENIGDPVEKGHKIMPWIKEIVSEATANDDACYGYSPTMGIDSTRQFIAGTRNAEGGAQIKPEDILFFNGLGDAISTTYAYLNKKARVLGPSPAYSTHSSAEATHAEENHLTYNLDPYKNWLPNLEEIRDKVRNNSSIAGMLVINPNNPTGTVCPEATMRGIVDIAREFDLFIIADEVYENIVYPGHEMFTLSQVIGDVPGIAMKGLSKEVPWPGSRCGWIEVYNKDKDPVFARYAKTIVDAKMLEVCSTTLPQVVLPKICGDERYKKHLKKNAEMYSKKADILYNILSKVEGIVIPKPEGAFYATIVFNENVLNEKKTLPTENSDIQKLVDRITQNVPLDKRFVYYLMASAGICVVPLSGLSSDLDGFRITLLEPDEKKFEKTIKILAGKIKEYINS